MNPDFIVYLQRCKDGNWRVWHANTSLTPPDDTKCVYVDSMKGMANAAAHTYVIGTEYRVCELPPEEQ